MKRSLYKRGKMRMLPGDVSKKQKIRMLESSEPFFVFPWQEMSKSAIKAYRKDHKKKIEKRFRLEEKLHTRSFL